MKLNNVMALAACALSAISLPAVAQPAVPARASAIAGRTVTVGDRQVHYLRAGSGATTIVLLHGWPQSSHEWRRVMPLAGEGQLEAGLKALGVRNVRVASIPNSGHWIAEE